MDEELLELEKYAPGELEVPTVFFRMYMSYVQYVRMNTKGSDSPVRLVLETWYHLIRYCERLV